MNCSCTHQLIQEIDQSSFIFCTQVRSCEHKICPLPWERCWLPRRYKLLTWIETSFSSGAVPPICKIIIARIVEPSELGKLNTFVALLQALIPLAFVPVLDRLWKSSAETFPGLDFLVTSSIDGVIFLLLLLVCALQTKDEH